MIIIHKDCLFSSIFTNIYLKNLIFKYIRLYNIFSSSRYIPSIDSISNHKFKEYFKEIEIDGNRINKDEDDIIFSDDEDEDDGASFNLVINNLNLLPINIDTIKLLSEPNIINNNNNIDNIDNNNSHNKNTNSNSSNFPSIKKIILLYKINNNSLKIFNSNSLNNQLSSISQLHLYRVNSNFKLVSSLLPESITELKIFEYYYEIKKETLPKRLKILEISFDSLKKSMFEKGSLPESLMSLHVCCFSQQFTFKSDILPKKLEYLKIVSSIYQDLPQDFKFPESLLHLELKCKKLKIKLPSNLKRLNIQTSKIKDNSLPPLLKHLCISTYQPITSKLPKYLLSLETDADSVSPSILPDTLQKLVFRTDESGLLNSNIKFVQSIISSSITHLDLDYDGYGSFNNGGFPMIQDNIFPKGLVYLNLGNSFNQVIGLNTLPKACLKTLILGIKFSQEIIENSIPSSVLNFTIKNPTYQHLVKLNNHYTILKICDNNNNYFQLYNSNPLDLRVLRLSSNFNEPLKVLQLYNKSNLIYLHLNKLFNQTISIEDLPINNSIKTLVLGNSFSNIINLEYFPNLELLNVKNSKPIIKTSTISSGLSASSTLSNNNSIGDSGKDTNSDLIYNFYNLKIIQVTSGNNKFLDSLNPIYYHFVRLSKQKERKSKNMY